jgi:hypothetical protein
MGVSCRDWGRRAVWLAVVAGLLAALLLGALPGHLAAAARPGALFLLPAVLLLACLLFARRYPGERALERLRLARRGRAPRRSALVPGPRRRLLAARRGGRLIAVSLAGRGPPLPAGCR